jgi:hypothetical protein
MRRLIFILLIAGLGWFAYGKYQARLSSQRAAAVDAESFDFRAAPPATKSPRQSTASFRCDGRTYCSQMTSCEEATYFLKNCPGTKMDGNHDGVPCEKQWCN